MHSAFRLCVLLRRSINNTALYLRQNVVSHPSKKGPARSRGQCQACILRKTQGYDECRPACLAKCKVMLKNSRAEQKDPVIRQQGDIDKLNMMLADNKQLKGMPIPTINLLPGVSTADENALTLLSQDQRKIVHILVKLQRDFEFPCTNDVKQAMERCSKEHLLITVDDFLHSMFHMVALIRELSIKFANQIPGIADLAKHDSDILIKAALSEVMAIRAARCYDAEIKAIVFANGQPCTLENMLDTGFGRYAELIYEFCHNLTEGMHTDDVEYALLTAICFLNSDRPGLENREQVRILQARFLDILTAYEMAKVTRGETRLIMFHARLADLLSISTEFSILVKNLKKGGSYLAELMEDAPSQPYRKNRSHSKK